MKVLKIVGAIVILAAVLVGTGFYLLRETTYTANSGFYYSGDKGHSYGDGTKEYSVGETVYMKVMFKVNTNKSKTSQVKVVLTIPNVQNVDAKYMDGQVITPNYDSVNNVTTYEFTANASKEAEEQECVIQFIPNAIGSVTMTLVYDDNIDPSYDIQSTLEFVEVDNKTEE
jgi:hypothetical protein